MRVEYQDGTAAEVVSDSSWKLTTDGPIRANNEYDGEEYDARMEMPGWSRAGFDDRAYDFGAALHEALTNSLCRVRWLRRKPAFPDSCLAPPLA